MCAGTLKKGPCKGDSGGPLIYRSELHEPVQIGIVAFGPYFCIVDVPAGFTKVSHPSIRNFIKNITEM